MSKPQVITFFDWYLPGKKSGGPVKSIYNLNKKLDFDFVQVCLPHDINEKEKYNGILLDQVNITSYGKIFYSYLNSIHAILQIRKLVGNNTVYFNNIFSFRFFLIPFILIQFKVFNPCKVVVAPRGMLGAGALKIKNRKKNLYLLLLKVLGIQNNTLFHLTDQSELNDVIQVLPKLSTENVCVIPNLPNDFSGVSRNKQLKTNDLKAVFISRISPKKNIEYAINLLSALNMNIQFDVYGTIEDAVYWEKCISLANHKSLVMNYKGFIDEDNFTDVFNHYDFSIYPSFNENYGHSIVESIAHACPTISSTNIPWNDLEENSIGINLSLNIQEDTLLMINFITNLKAIDIQKFQSYYNNRISLSEKQFKLYLDLFNSQHPLSKAI